MGSKTEGIEKSELTNQEIQKQTQQLLQKTSKLTSPQPLLILTGDRDNLNSKGTENRQ
ncbi:MAG: hypothetical protein QNJ54_03565 [Prochloraceae cyanobacterium]|nr:hypothetical protein [Prochloraceae cyanobacterium]